LPEVCEMIVFAIFRKGLLTRATLLKSLDGCEREGAAHTHAR
jgi:hypothetical protein